MIKAWKIWWKRRKARKYWTLERQFEHLHNMISADHRWLAHDKTADALTSRYLAALSPDWFKRDHVDASQFRREIGLEPKYNKDIVDKEFQRGVLWLRGEAPYNTGPLSNIEWD